MLRVTGIDIERCPVCQQGVLQPVGRLAPAPAAWNTSCAAAHLDSAPGSGGPGSRGNVRPLCSRRSPSCGRLAHAVGTLLPRSPRPSAWWSRIPTAACHTYRSRPPCDRIPVRYARDGFSRTGFIRHARRTTDKSQNVRRNWKRPLIGGNVTQLLGREKALALLEKTLKEGAGLRSLSNDDPVWETWLRNVLVRTAAVFGDQSPQVREMAHLVTAAHDGKGWDRPQHSGRIVALLNSFYAEVSDLWSDERETAQAAFTSPGGEHLDTRRGVVTDRIFIVHGHDHGRMQAVARFLEQLALKPIILHERPSSGDTIVEKLERHGDAAYAVVLLTPDDIGGLSGSQPGLRPRARQNVVLELGYFIGRLGRQRTCALVVEGVEIPSDYSGVLYIPLSKTDEWKFLLARELRAAGLPIDMNKIA